MEEGLTPLLNTLIMEWPFVKKKQKRYFADLPPPLKSLPPFKERDARGESKRGEASLAYPVPLPLDKGKGDKGGWDSKQILKRVRLVNDFYLNALIKFRGSLPFTPIFISFRIW